jgi:sugar phosphate isomerase/epimerase
MDPRIGFCIDIGHAARANANLVEAVHATGARLYDVHVKDLTDMKAKESQVAVGQGVLPFKDLFQALIDIKYKGFIDLEYEIKGDNPMPGVIESLAYMRGVLAGMGYLTHA